uniref:HAUS augmin-like complex, subunit 1 n=1 Tax=Cyprinus carpio TaxID=7962 RepID=A0A8C2L4B4_CYPCA
MRLTKPARLGRVRARAAATRPESMFTDSLCSGSWSLCPPAAAGWSARSRVKEMEVASAAHIRKVSQWLKKVFGQQPVPEFEVNTRTVEILYELAESSEMRCREAEMLIEDHKQKTEEYSSDGAHLQEVLLQAVGLQAGGLSKPTVDLLSALEEAAEVLKIRDTSLGSYMPAISKLTDDVLEAEKTDRRLQRELSAVRKKMTATVVLRKKLQDDLMKLTHMQQVEAATAEERLLNMDFMKNKSRDLTYRNKLAQEKLDSRQMEDSLTHQAILQLSERIAALKEETLPLKKKLEPYNDLSPSPALARVKIEEAKRELVILFINLVLFWHLLLLLFIFVGYSNFSERFSFSQGCLGCPAGAESGLHEQFISIINKKKSI